MEARSDQELVLACLVGQAEAFEALLGRYQVRVFSFLMRMAGNASDAEDLCQETFLKAFENLEAYDRQRPLGSWLLAVAHNTAVDFLRARKPAGSLDDEDETVELCDPAQSVEGAAQAAWDQQTMERVLAELPPIYREALVLRHHEGLDYASLAEVLQVPEGTAKIRLFRGRELLRRKLAALGYGA
ncbi:MAG: RNA polymerase sigma factor [Elusimicrobia bacterium]|nr:RNA polymerase sigma factor [Elusimicrobiota bacterium]